MNVNFFIRVWLVGLSILVLHIELKAQAQWLGSPRYDGGFSIYGHDNPTGELVIPNFIGGYPVTVIAEYAFLNETEITGIQFPSSLKIIADRAFDGCTNLTQLSFGSQITNIASRAFLNCTQLSSFSMASGNPSYSSIDGILFNKNQTVLTHYPAGRTGHYEIPSSVTKINRSAFSTAVSLTALTIPYGVLTIEHSAFRECGGLTNLVIPESVVTLYTSAFNSCLDLSSITIPDSVTGIADRVFSNCPKLARVKVGTGVTSLGAYAFENCPSLSEIYFRGSPPTVGYHLFANSDPVIYYLPGIDGWSDSYASLPTQLWLPKIVTEEAFGGESNHFKFGIAWTKGLEVVVFSNPQLSASGWKELDTVTLTNDLMLYTDSSLVSFPARFYRVGYSANPSN